MNNLENKYMYHGTPKCINNLIPGAYVDDAPTGGHAGCLGVSFSTKKCVCLNFALCGNSTGWLYRVEIEQLNIIDSDKCDADQFNETEVRELIDSGVDGVRLVPTFAPGQEHEIVVFNYKKINIDAKMKLLACDFKRYWDAWK